MSEQTLYKGYIRTKEKNAIDKYKNTDNLKTLQEVQSLPEYAGILAPDAILVDIDDSKQSELLMNIVEHFQLNCRVYQTTRGRHFLFKNSKIDKCFTHCTLACGFTADIKSGFKNSYEVLKFNGEERFIEWDIEKGQEYQEIPKWLFPIKTNAEFLKMKAGDGRNQELFNYILTLQSNDFSVEESRETIRIINKFVLPEPLSDDELEVILRDDAFQKPVFYKGTTFLFDRFATYMKNNHHIIRINNQLHMYQDGIYISGQADIEGEMIKHIPQLNRSKRKEVLDYLDVLIRENTPATEAHLIAFRNGILNVYDDSFTPLTPEHIITNRIDWDYNPQAYDELTDKTLNKIACNDESIRALLEEMAGSCLYRENTLAGGKAFILTGAGANGKSTFLEMIKNMLGEYNISSLDLKELSEKFQNAEICGKLANIGDDIDSEYISNAAVFRKLVTGERIQVQRKGERPFEFNNYAKMMFSANNIPRLGSAKDSYAILRRLVIIPFEAKFSPEDDDYNPNIKHDLRQQSAMEYLIKIALDGLKRVLKNNAYTKSEQVQKELNDFEISNNNIFAFVKEYEADGYEIVNNAVNDVYDKYNEFCLSNGIQRPFSKIEFSRQVCKMLNLETKQKKIQGKQYQIYIHRCIS